MSAAGAAALADMCATLRLDADPMALVWAGLNVGTRGAILTAAGHSWVGVSGAWHDIPVPQRVEIKRRCRMLRDLLVKAFPAGSE
jgi:hypothetical protein